MKEHCQCCHKQRASCSKKVDLWGPWIELMTASVGALWRFNCQILQFKMNLMTGMGQALGVYGTQCECCQPAGPRCRCQQHDEPGCDEARRPRTKPADEPREPNDPSDQPCEPHPKR